MSTVRKILCLGDFHLGARPRRLPQNTDASSMSVAKVWKRAVDYALDGDVGLILLPGDLIDRANRYYEAFGPLTEGLQSLMRAGVEVCAVAGNHDFDLLRRLEKLLDDERFHLLGDRGRWERFTWCDGNGAPLLHVDGWSFPTRDVKVDPLESYDLAVPESAHTPRIGLIHGDLDDQGSSNAPLTLVGLKTCADGGIDAWVLGHIHHSRLSELTGGRWALYPGSLQPRDWSEDGQHGAWVVELADGRLGQPELVPLATVRWHRMDVDLTGAVDLDGVAARVTRGLQEASDKLGAAGPGAPERIFLRVKLTGRTGVPRWELEEVGRQIEEGTDLVAGDGRAQVAEIEIATRPAVDLEDVARGDGPPALLADLLLRLKGGGSPDPEIADLLTRIGRRIEDVHSLSSYTALRDPPPGPEVRREHLERAAWSLLEGYLIQKAGAG